MAQHPLSDFRPAVRAPLPWILLMRLLNNTGNRFPYSFLGPLAAGTGFSVESIGAVLAIRDLTGLSAPALGKLADNRGNERLMRTGAVVSAVALAFSALGAWPFVLGTLIFGVAKITFDVALNAWIGNEVSYQMRGRAVGMTELTWAGAALVGIPICGLLIDTIGWRAAPLTLGIAAVPAVLGLRSSLSDSPHTRDTEQVNLQVTRPIVLTSLAVAAVSLASQFVVIAHGLWLEATYGLSPSRIGFAVISIGVVEAIATTSSARFTDQLGKRNSMLIGSAVQAVAIMALALAPHPPLWLGLAWLAFAFLGFEFAFVSSLPLIAELNPAARGATIGLAIGGVTLARAVGSWTGTAMFERQGFQTVMVVAAATAVAALLIVLAGVPEPQDASYEGDSVDA